MYVYCIPIQWVYTIYITLVLFLFVNICTKDLKWKIFPTFDIFCYLPRPLRGNTRNNFFQNHQEGGGG